MKIDDKTSRSRVPTYAVLFVLRVILKTAVMLSQRSLNFIMSVQ